jgi:hypothetical protein
MIDRALILVVVVPAGAWGCFRAEIDLSNFLRAPSEMPSAWRSASVRSGKTAQSISPSLERLFVALQSELS